MEIVLTPDILISAYRHGIFPMADSAHSHSVHWVCPELRGQLCIGEMHIPKRLRKTVRQMKIKSVPYEIKINADFEQTIRLCAQDNTTRRETWINAQIIDAYCALNALGHAHSVECWQDGVLVGGLYGLSIGGAFFGESMFSRRTDTSKVALVHLAARLYHGGYEILDTQFTNAHLEQFGVYEVEHAAYMTALSHVLDRPCVFDFDVPKERTLIQAYLDR